MSTEPILIELKVGEEVKIPDRGAFASFPKLRVSKVVKDGIVRITEYWPGTGSIPSTLHQKTIRLLNLQWNGIVVQGEYDDSSKLLKITKGNTDSVTVEII